MAKKKQQEETIVNVGEVYTKTEMFVDRHRKTLTTVLVGVALAAAAFFGYRALVVQPHEQEAMNQIWKAQLYFENDSLDAAVNGDGLYPGFQEIADNYDGTKAGMLANYYMGIINRDNVEYEAALENFKKVDFSDNAVGILAMGNVGDMYVELEQYEEGAKWLTKAATEARSSASEEFSAPFYLYKAATVNYELGNYPMAYKQFNSIVEDYPKSSEHDKAIKWAGRLDQYK
jgi:tetratricopeptide (TPR) repeat protein